MPPRTSRGRGVCQRCGKDASIRKNGQPSAHRCPHGRSCVSPGDGPSTVPACTECKVDGIIAKQRAAEQEALSEWTAPTGTPVEVTKDDGSTMQTVTDSMPWTLGGGTPVILLKGISGGYRLTRVRVVQRRAEVA